MSYKRISPIAVIEGGTSDTSITAYSVLCGGTTTTGALQVVSGVGSSTQVLTSNGAASLATWQNSKGISTITGPGSSTNNAIATWNSTGGTALFNNSAITLVSGQMTNTAQPAFSAYLGTSTANNKIGNGSTFYTVLFDTKVFDQGTNYSTTTGIFTAPVTGRYMFIVQCTVQGVNNANIKFIQGQIVTTGRTFYIKSAVFKAQLPNGYLTEAACVVAPMTANDTASFRLYGSYLGSAQSIGILGSSSPLYTYFAGYLVC